MEGPDENRKDGGAEIVLYQCRLSKKRRPCRVVTTEMISTVALGESNWGFVFLEKMTMKLSRFNGAEMETKE
jgi:hypothetical protein